jgi:hypothetical protein
LAQSFFQNALLRSEMAALNRKWRDACSASRLVSSEIVG